MQVATRALRWLVAVGWVALVAMLVRSQLPAARPPEPSVAPAYALAAGDAPADEEAWMSVYMQNRKVGYSHHKVVGAADGYRFEEVSSLRATVLDTPQTVLFSARGNIGRDYALRDFSVSLQSGVGRFELEGRVGERAVTIDMKIGDEKRTQSLPIEGPIYMPIGARRRLVASGMAPGRELALEVFDPASMRTEPVALRVEERAPLEWNGEKRDAWRVRESFHGIETTIWIDDDGRTLREEGPMGMVTVRETSERAMTAGLENGDGIDLMAAVAIPVEHALTDPRRQATLALRIAGLGNLTLPEDARQSFRDGVLSIRRERADATTFPLPYAGAEWRDDLKSTPFLQSDDPKVRGKAEEILAGEIDARRAAERLRLWVYRNLEKVPVASIPNALQVLEMGRGDCNEHAVLFAALARAVGLPARVVAGAVYVNGVFLYHAWNEVWLGSGWVSADAAFDQMPVDATHLKLVTGGPEEHIALLQVMGKLSIQVVSETTG